MRNRSRSTVWVTAVLVFAVAGVLPAGGDAPAGGEDKKAAAPAAPAKAPATQPAKAGDPSSPATQPAKGAAASTPPATQPAGDAAAAPDVKVVTRDDGSLLIDDQFILRGKGTAAEPFQVSWDYLVAGTDTLDLKAENPQLPGRLKFLDGKHVIVSGYALTASAGGPVTESLVMFNMWDGCCMGAPPTVFDSIEVKHAPIEGLNPPGIEPSIVAAAGRLEVNLKVVRGWPISLFRMQDARLRLP